MNRNMLAAAMVAHGDNQQTLADAMGISLSRMNAKINGYDGADFWSNEIKFIADRYGLGAKELYNIFFAEKVS